MEHPSHAPRSRLLPVAVMLLTASLVVIVAAIGTEHRFSEVTETTRARAQAREGRLQLVRLLSLFKDIETGARGYALTGEAQFLQPHDVARQAIPAAYAQLKAAWPAAANEAPDWVLLDRLVEQRLQLAKDLIAQRRGRTDEMRDLLDDGREAMDAIRVEVARRDGVMAVRIDMLDAKVRALQSATARAAWLLAGATIVLVALAFALLLRERQRRIALEGELRDSNRDLDHRVHEKTIELAAARDRIADFAASQQRAIEDERRRLSREVHDQIGQVFSAIRMIVRGLPAGALPRDQALVIDQAIDMGVATARRIAAELRPPLFDDLGLDAAVRHLADGRLTPAGIRHEVVLADAACLNEAAALTVYRILQEALTNVVRHAGASAVRISGAVADAHYRVEVTDDGRGVTSPVRAGALGIVGMQERAALLGGRVTVENDAHGGTTLAVFLPLNKEGTASDEDPAA